MQSLKQNDTESIKTEEKTMAITKTNIIITAVTMTISIIMMVIMRIKIGNLIKM